MSSACFKHQVLCKALTCHPVSSLQQPRDEVWLPLLNQWQGGCVSQPCDQVSPPCAQSCLTLWGPTDKSWWQRCCRRGCDLETREPLLLPSEDAGQAGVLRRDEEAVSTLGWHHGQARPDDAGPRPLLPQSWHQEHEGSHLCSPSDLVPGPPVGPLELEPRQGRVGLWLTGFQPHLCVDRMTLPMRARS